MKLSRAEAIREAKRFDRVLILEDKDSREFFRFVDSEISEYERTKAYGKQIRLTQSEQVAEEEFFSN